jgi:succinyl-diaminopimelate desuccinylase
MKTQVAGAMKLLEFVVENNIKIKFGVLIVTDEETVGKCSDFWVNKIGLKSKIILDGDGEHGINKIIDRKKACVFVDLISKGKLAHGSKPWLGIDANENLIQSIVNLRKVFPYICKNSKPESEWFTTMHVGIIKGGRATNSIADYAEASLDFRYVEDYNDEKLMKIIEQNLVGDTKAIQKEKGILMLNDINNKYLQFYKNIIEKEIGGNVEFEIGLGTSDSRFFVNKDTAIIVAEPLGGGAHSDDEWLNVEEFYKYFKIRKKFLSSVETIL